MEIIFGGPIRVVNMWTLISIPFKISFQLILWKFSYKFEKEQLLSLKSFMANKFVQLGEKHAPSV